MVFHRAVFLALYRNSCGIMPIPAGFQLVHRQLAELFIRISNPKVLQRRCAYPAVQRTHGGWSCGASAWRVVTWPQLQLSFSELVSLVSVFSDVLRMAQNIPKSLKLLGSQRTDQFHAISPLVDHAAAPQVDSTSPYSISDSEHMWAKETVCSWSAFFLAAHMLGAQNSAQSNQENSSTKPDVEGHRTCTWCNFNSHMQIYDLDIWKAQVIYSTQSCWNIADDRYGGPRLVWRSIHVGLAVFSMEENIAKMTIIRQHPSLQNGCVWKKGYYWESLMFTRINLLE